MTKFEYVANQPIHPDDIITPLLGFGELEMKEQHLLTVLRQFDLVDALETIAACSRYVANKGVGSKGYGIALRDEITGVFITQFALAYLSLAFLRVASPGATKRRLSERAQSNLFALSNIHSTRLSDPLRSLGDNLPTDHQMMSTFLRLRLEQFLFQQDRIQLAGRAWALFERLPPEVDPNLAKLLDTNFRKRLGLGFREYLTGAAAIMAAAGLKQSLYPETITKSELADSHDFARPAIIEPMFRILSASPDELIEIDSRWNGVLSPESCKYRLNPLTLKPIIRMPQYKGGYPYLVPNASLLWPAMFDGLYWHVHDAFEMEGQHLHFRQKFGKVLERYVGELLKKLMDPTKVMAEFPFKGRSGTKQWFADWWIISGNDLFLFEVKSCQLTLVERQGADHRVLKEKVAPKVAEAIHQMWKLSIEIDTNDELAPFRGKRIHSFVIVRDVPWVSAGFYNDLMLEAMMRLVPEQTRACFRDFPTTVLDLSDFETCHWDLLSKLGAKPLLSMREAVLTEPTDKVRQDFWNPYIEESYQNFLETLIGAKAASQVWLKSRLR